MSGPQPGDKAPDFTAATDGGGSGPAVLAVEAVRVERPVQLAEGLRDRVQLVRLDLVEKA